MAEIAFDEHLQNDWQNDWRTAGARQETLRISGGTLIVHRVGKGIPLVCLHGWAMGGRAFCGQFDLALAGFEVIAPDLPGFAGTAPLETPSTIETMTSAIDEMIAQLELTNVIVIGWSMGAMIGWKLAARQPEYLAGLITLDMSPRLAAENNWALGLRSRVSTQQLMTMTAHMIADWQTYCGVFLGGILATPSRQDSQMLETLAQSADVTTAVQAWQSLASFDARPLLGTITCPAMAIHGGASLLYPREVGDYVADNMPNCQSIVLDGVGHAPHLEAPQLFNHLVTQLCAQAGLLPEPHVALTP